MSFNWRQLKGTNVKKLNIEKVNGDWNSLSKKELDEKGYFPNKVLWKNDPQQLIIDVSRSKEGDFALNQKCFEKALAKIGWQCYVRFVEQDGTYVNADTVKNVKRIIKQVKPLKGQYGSYWWLDDDFSVASVKKTSVSCPI